MSKQEGVEEEVLTKEEKKKPLIEKAVYQSMLQYFQNKYPKCFTIKPSPLAIKIHQKLMEQELDLYTGAKIRNFLYVYTRKNNYRNNLKVGRPRLNLDGSSSAIVTEPEAKAKSSNSSLRSDALFKSIMTNELAAREFLEEYLPIKVRERLDLSTIKVEPESFVEDDLKRRLSDIIYSVKTTAGDKAFIYTLVEHQSSNDHWMAMRLQRYCLLLSERHAKQKKKLPIIVPLVVYNGKKSYDAPRNYWDLFTDPDLAKTLLTEDYKLIDLQSMSDNDIAKPKHISLMQYILKHARERDMLKVMQELFEKLPDAVLLDESQGYLYIKKILWYIDSKVPAAKQVELNKIIIDNLSKEKGEQIMKTIADTYIEQGLEQGLSKGLEQGLSKGLEQGLSKGLEQGKIEIATNMFREKSEISFVSTVTGLPIDDLEKLQQQI